MAIQWSCHTSGCPNRGGKKLPARSNRKCQLTKFWMKFINPCQTTFIDTTSWTKRTLTTSNKPIVWRRSSITQMTISVLAWIEEWKSSPDTNPIIFHKMQGEESADQGVYIDSTHGTTGYNFNLRWCLSNHEDTTFKTVFFLIWLREIVVELKQTGLWVTSPTNTTMLGWGSWITIEAFHHTLKHNYLKGKFNKHVDTFLLNLFKFIRKQNIWKNN